MTKKYLLSLLCSLLYLGLAAQAERCQVVSNHVGVFDDNELYGLEILAIHFQSSQSIMDTTLKSRIGRVSDSLDWTQLSSSLFITPEDILASKRRQPIEVEIYEIADTGLVSSCRSKLILQRREDQTDRPYPPKTELQGSLHWADSCSQTTDQTITGWTVTALNADGLAVVETVKSDAQGNFSIFVDAGKYLISVTPEDPNWQACQQTRQINIDTVEVVGDEILEEFVDHDTIDLGSFHFYPNESNCTNLKVDIATHVLRPCFPSTYHVDYANIGTLDASAVFIEIELDPAVTLDSASIPFQLQDDGALIVDIGDLAIGQGGSFELFVQLECDLEAVGSTYCVEARISSANDCSANYAGPDLIVDGACQGDSILFRIQNIGMETTTGPIQYTVVEDVTSFAFEHEPLRSGESFDLGFPARGATYRVEVEQEADNPIGHFRSKTIEGCTDGTNESSRGYHTMFSEPDDATFLSIDCRESVASFDPNDKMGQPKGIGEAKIIYPGTTIEYQIRFQNTGTDTAFKVEILDILPQELDISTLTIGASSHPFEAEVSGQFLRFIFEDIFLPDSNVNEAASHGYVQFKISPRADLMLGDTIENKAAIYFDFNEPVITDSTIHILGERQYGTTDVPDFEADNQLISLYPNPNQGRALYLSRSLVDGANLVILDPLGRIISQHTIQDNYVDLNNQLADGLYFYRISGNNQSVKTGKLVVGKN